MRNRFFQFFTFTILAVVGVAGFGMILYGVHFFSAGPLLIFGNVDGANIGLVLFFTGLSVGASTLALIMHHNNKKALSRTALKVFLVFAALGPGGASLSGPFLFVALPFAIPSAAIAGLFYALGTIGLIRFKSLPAHRIVTFLFWALGGALAAVAGASLVVMILLGRPPTTPSWVIAAISGLPCGWIVGWKTSCFRLEW